MTALKTAEGLGEHVLGAAEVFHFLAIARIASGIVLGALGAAAGFGDAGECFAFVGHIALGGFDEVGDEVVAAFELDVDLGEGVLEAVLESDQAVVDGDRVGDCGDDYGQADPGCQVHVRFLVIGYSINPLIKSHIVVLRHPCLGILRT